MTTGTTHVARAEEWPIMPTEWVHTLLKPWNFFDETPTLGKKKRINNHPPGNCPVFLPLHLSFVRACL